MATRVLWIDGVGSFALCEDDEISIGQASPDSKADLTIRGELSRNAAVIQRVGEYHVLRPIQPVSFNGDLSNRPVILSDQDRISFGGRVEIKYIRPTRLSGTARLELLGPSRWNPLLNAAILLADSCILGPGQDCHIPCPSWNHRAILFRHGEGWMCRVPEIAGVQWNGKLVRAPFPLVAGQRIHGDEISMILE